ncbi:hypothetical protein CHS0354_012919 [Potamilus streckersoni]|uniref:Alpha-1,3-glucosyltransferase n=1 Tax=Potamilus streckersoni TaxID=2493646 RepID=A0AAE0RNN7_9BIVA|nr:hypothetical protein CHS0354_012919 [Potamilus streckersoni]
MASPPQVLASKTRAANLLEWGCMPLFPPARRECQEDTANQIPIGSSMLPWPPNGWKWMNPDQKLLQWEYVSMLLENSIEKPLPSSLNRGVLLDKFNMLALPGTSVPMTAEQHLIYRKGQLLQLLSRLFPVKRGLCHAYWAPNFWVLYNVVDKAATVTASKLNLLAVESNHTAVMTGGLVQEYDHVVLPSITPFVTLVVTLLAIMPSLFLLWSRPRGPASFVRTLVLCAFGFFMFSWHVHEKAILLIILPLSLLMLYKKKDAQLFLVISTVGHYSLFPLLYKPQEIPIKVCLLLIYTLYIYTGLGKMFGFSWSWSSLPLLSQAESLYILGLVLLELYNNVIHSVLGLSERLPFLPLLLTSFYCAVGVTYTWIKFYWLTFQEKPRKTESKMH